MVAEDAVFVPSLRVGLGRFSGRWDEKHVK
jgi:hypothetical protein